MSVADAVGTISSVLQTAYKVYEAVKTIKDAPETVRVLRLEVTRIRGLLSRIVEDAGADASGRGRCEDVLKLQPDLIEQARLLTEVANRFLEKATRSREGGTREVKSVKWLLYVSEAKDLAAKFQAFHSAVSAIYSVDASARMLVMEPRLIHAVEERITHTMEHNLASAVDEGFRRAMREEMGRALDERRESLVRVVYSTLASTAREQQEGRHLLFDEFSILRDNPEAIQGPPIGGLQCTTSDSRRDSTRTGYDRPSTSGSDADLRFTLASSASGGSGTTSPASSVAGTFPSVDGLQARCAEGCRCRCHRPSESYRLTPSALTPWIGDIRIPGSLISSLTPTAHSCDDIRCRKSRSRLAEIRRWLPTWFARAEAAIRSRSCPLRSIMQTQRIVRSLSSLYYISLDEFKIMLSTRQITVNDIQPDGYTVLHQLAYRAMVKHGDESVAFTMMHFAIDAGARHDWEYYGFSMTELMVHHTKCLIQDSARVSSLLQSFERNIAKPLLQEDLGEIWDSMRTKRGWSDLHYLIANPPTSSAQFKRDLGMTLRRPNAFLDVNTRDRFGRTPLEEAIYSCPDVIDTLLQAGANPHLVNRILGNAVQAQSWSAISPLIRAGVDVNERYRWSNGTISTALHDTIRPRPALGLGHRLRTAHELVCHGRHMLDWDVEDEHGRTPLDRAAWFMNEQPNDAHAMSLYEFYKSQRPPLDTSPIRKSCIDGVVEGNANTSTFLIKAGLAGDTKAIGCLINAGAMVNERDAEGRTLLHLVAMGVVPNGYAVAVEVVRHGGHGVDWNATTINGQTAEALAEKTLKLLPSREEIRKRTAISSFVKRNLRRLLLAPLKVDREEAMKILELLHRRTLPADIEYIYPCMDPSYCKKCSSRPCLGYCNDSNGPRMPGSFD